MVCLSKKPKVRSPIQTCQMNISIAKQRYQKSPNAQLLHIKDNLQRGEKNVPDQLCSHLRQSCITATHEPGSTKRVIYALLSYLSFL